MIHLAILRNELSDEHELWVQACKAHHKELEFDVINLTKNNWLEQILAKEYDFYLCKPPGINSLYKQLYDERVMILSMELALPIYPTLTEILIYENKRFLSYWLAVNRLPHPKTWVFYDKKEALATLRNYALPLVAKVNIGASGSGVTICRSWKQVEDYIEDVFSVKGASQRWGPNLTKGKLLQRGIHYIFKPADIGRKLERYKRKRNERQTGFVLFQEFVEHEYEWRVVAIGDSYFAHKKLKIGDKASGSTLKKYDNPPLKLLDFARSIMERFGFYSQAIDLFETPDGQLLINEMQCIFGQSDPYQMLVDGQPGRYRYINGQWIFEKGDFNSLESYALRLEHVIELIKKKKSGT